MKTVNPATALAAKEDLRGATCVLLGFESENVPSTLPGAEDGQTYDVLRFYVEEDGPEKVQLLASGKVMSRQARETGFPFKAKLTQPRGKRYWQFDPV